ncbi:MAG TPA: DegT/DnrJ/EryC1/StrS family aminotransferase [Bryobacteraceae bacterium]|nr:DegT/DnrJ/EryC1/StrS family aminotransferase [Bryobacteraceae bacterium]
MAQHISIRSELLAALTRVLDSGRFILGEEVTSLEQEIAPYTAAPYAIACASGSDALLLALMALDIRPGDEVLTVPFTFFSTASAISRLGATPVFADIDPATFTIDLDRAGHVLHTHHKVRAIIAVHLFGGCADMGSLIPIAQRHGVPIIEDAAQAIGAECNGKRAGSLGYAGCFSFYPSKNLGGLGDGGMLTTNDESLASRLRSLRVHGGTEAYIHASIGINSRLDALQAAALRVKLRHLDGWTLRRQQNAELYRTALATTGAPVFAPSPAAFQTRHVYNQFVIRCPQRDRLRRHLRESGIGTAVYYPVPLHLQQCFAELGYRAGDFPCSERAAEQVLALPVNPEVSADDIEYICGAIASCYR